MLLNISNELAEQLQQIAQDSDITIDDVLRSLLDQNNLQLPTITLADLAQNAREANLSSDDIVDTAKHSREILNNEYADYLKRRMDAQNDEDNNR